VCVWANVCRDDNDKISTAQTTLRCYAEQLALNYERILLKLLLEALWSDGSSYKHSSGIAELGSMRQEVRKLWSRDP
jgi:hypothetical protein